jgi:transposase-like protein
MDIEQIKLAILGLSETEQQALLSSIASQHKPASRLSDLLKQQEEKKIFACPDCNSTEIIAKGYRHAIRKFKCKSCGRNFSSTTNTALYKIHKKEKWEAYLQCMEDGLSIRKAAKRVGISMQTSFDWRHKVLERLGRLHADKLEGIAEADEMFFMYSEKGSKNLDRPARKRAGKRISQDMVNVLVGLDRKGHLIAKNNGRGGLKREAVNKTLSGKFAPGTTLCTDGSPALIGLAKREKLAHKAIIGSKNMVLKNKAYHIQTVNAAHTQIRTDMAKFRGVATKYLQNYLNWFVAQKLLKDKLDSVSFWLFWSITINQIIEAT